MARGCVVNEGDRTLKVVVLVNIESTLLKCVIDEFRKLREEPVNRSKWRREEEIDLIRVLSGFEELRWLNSAASSIGVQSVPAFKRGDDFDRWLKALNFYFGAASITDVNSEPEKVYAAPHVGYGGAGHF